MEEKTAKTSQITVTVGMNDNNLPIKMKWSAEDGDVKDAPTKAMLLSLWDPIAKNTMKVDLWTKDMSVEEMKQFFHQTLLSLSDSFERATGEHKISEDLKDYCHHFAEKMQILPEEN